MNAKKLAAHYLRYFASTRDHEIADNAPAEFWAFVRSLPASTDRASVHEALKAINSSDQIVVPDVVTLLQWLAARPHAVDKADALLGGKTPPKNLSTLLRHTYLAEIQVAKSLVQKFIAAEIAKYEE